MDSILTSIKKTLGIAADYQHFDDQIMLHINSTFSVLHQLGVGPESGFYISDSSATWKDFMGDDPRLNFVKTYVGIRVRLLFDPPVNTSAVKSMEETAQEIEWRITVIPDTN